MSSYNFYDLLQVVSQAVPDRTALVYGDESLSYAGLWDLADQYSAVLAGHGVGHGDRVGLQLVNSPAYLAALIGACRVGAVPFNVNYRYSPGELQYLYENAQARALLFNTEFAGAVAEACATGFTPGAMLEAGGDGLGRNIEDELARSLPLPPPVCADKDLIIIYTGGTTGYPKGVMWPQEHLFFSALGGGGFFHEGVPVASPQELATRAAEGMELTILPLAPLMHGAALWTALVALFAGHKVVLSEQTNFDAAHAWGLISKHGVNIVSIVGDAMALPLVEALEANRGAPAEQHWQLDHLFNVGSGGAVFSEALQNRFTAVLPNLFVTSSLGATETGTVGMGDVETSEGIMRYAPRDDLAVVVDGQRLAAAGEEGVLARSGMIPVGYLGDEEKSRETFIEVDGVHFALGGDAARLEDDGSITVLGRGSMCINTGGEKVFPEEVESTLKQYDAVDDALVVGVAHEKWGQQVVAVYSANVEQVNEDDLRSFCRESLAGYKVPKRFCRVDYVRRNVVGKPDYKWAKSLAEAVHWAGAE